MRLLDIITDTMDRSLSKLLEIVKDRDEAAPSSPGWEGRAPPVSHHPLMQEL